MTTKAATVRAVLYLPGRSAVRSFPSEEAIRLSIRKVTRKWSIFLHLVGERTPQEGCNCQPLGNGFWGQFRTGKREGRSWDGTPKSRYGRVYATTFGGDGLMERVRKFFLIIL
jgi:hypothetical protein